MLGDLGLRHFQDVLEMAYAKRSFRQQVNNAEPCRITEALINLDEFHDGNLLVDDICVNSYIRVDVYI